MKYKVLCTSLQFIAILSIFLFNSTSIAWAQNVVWANGIVNPNSDISVKNICSNSAGENYTVGGFRGETIDFDAGAGIDTISANINTGYIFSRAGFITKTDNGGNHMWAKALLPYTDDSYTYIYDVAADANGNVFVVGTYFYTIDFDPGPGIDSLNSHLTQGTFLLKLDQGGNLLWAKSFVGSIAMYTLKTNQNNDVIISGLFNNTQDFDPGPSVYNMTVAGGAVFVLKLDNSGSFIWANFWQGSHANKIMHPAGNLDVDNAGNIYVSGGIGGTQIDLDPGPAVSIDSGKTFAVKLDPMGNFIWGHANAGAICVIKVSKYNDLFTSGDPGGNGYYPNLTKYNSAGIQIWTKTIEDPLLAPQYLIHLVSSIAEDTVGNVILAGKSGAKYVLYTTDSAGNFLWIKKSKTNIYISELCAKVNASNDIMLAGDFKDVFDVDFGPNVDTVGQAGKYAFFLVKYNYCGNNFNLNYNVCDSLVLPDTTLYASANYIKEYPDMANCDSNLFIHAIVNVLKDTVINACDSAVYNGMTYTQSGVYTQIFPPFVPGCDSVKQIFVNINTPANLPPFLNLIQTFQPAAPPLNGQAYIMSGQIEIDSMYNMYVGGAFNHKVDFNPLGAPYIDTSFYDLYNGTDGFVTRYDSSGLLSWMHNIQTNDPNGSENIRSLCLNEGLDLYSVTEAPYNIGQRRLDKFNFANTYFGTTLMFGASNWNVNQVLNDPTSNSLVKIGFYDSVTGPQWAKKNLAVWRGNDSVTFSTGGQFVGYQGAVDMQGNIYVVSSMQPVNGGLEYCMIAKLDSNLNMLWNKQIDQGGVANPTPFATRINQMKVDANGSLLLCGRFRGTLDIDISPATYNLVSKGDNDAFIARFDTSANVIWAHAFGGANYDEASSLTTDLVGKIYLGGTFNSPSIDLDPSAGVSFFMKACGNTNWQGGFISKYKPDGTFMQGTGSGKNITELEFKAPKRIYATGYPFVQVFELGNDIIVSNTDTICAGDSLVVGNSVYYQSGVFTAIFAIAPGVDSIVITNLTVIPNNVIANASDTSLCIGDSVILFGSGALSYSWNNFVFDNITFSPLVTSTYIVTGTNMYGCINTDSITVVVNALPTVSANATDTAVCLGDSIILSGSGASSYIWNNLAIDSILFAPLATGYFVVTGTDTNGCMNQDSIELIVNALPPVIANASDTSLCIGDSVILFGSGALTYIWDNPVIDSMIFLPNVTTSYLVTGTDTNGCVNTDNITVFVNALPNVVANASDSSVCIGNPVILYGTGADSFSWTNAVIDSVAFYPIDTAMYVVTGIDVNGCIGQDSININANQIPFPILVFSGDTLYCTNVSGVTIYWYKDTVAIDSLVNYYVVTQNGNYEVFVVDSNGCAGADSISMLNVGYLRYDNVDLIKVFPNPTQGAINIAFEMMQAGDVDLMIIDLLGNRIYASNNKILTSGKQQLKIDLTQYHLTNGIYFLNIVIDGKRNVVKFEYQK